MPAHPDPPVLQAPRDRGALRGPRRRTTAVHVAERVAGIASVAYALRVLARGRARARRRAAAARAALAGRLRRARADGVPSRRDRQGGRDDRPVRSVRRAFRSSRSRCMRLRARADRQPLRPRRGRARAASAPRARSTSTSCCARAGRARARPRARPAAVPRHRLDDRPADRQRATSTRALVEDYGAVGPVARGSGLSDRRAPRASLRRVPPARAAGRHPPRGRRDGPRQGPLRRAVRVAADPAPGDRPPPPPRRRARRAAARRRQRRGVRLGRGAAGRARRSGSRSATG